MKISSLSIVLLVGISLSHALTQKEICKTSSAAVVQIDVADGLASGFVVSPDGWIVTAGHVVYDNGELRSTVAVVMPDGKTQLAKVFADVDSIERDFALLKIEGTNLPFLEFGQESEFEIGSDITIIGFPFSAENKNRESVTAKFCLSGMVSATESITSNVFNHKINVHVIYFQGPAIKGISGGPIISRDSGRVIGIQSTKLTGIGTDLAKVREQLKAYKSGGITMTAQISGADFGDSINGIINVLDNQLANGLGAATSGDDASTFLTITKRHYEQQKKH